MIVNFLNVGTGLPIGLLLPTLLTVAWSLGVEMFYWILMPLLLTSRPARLWLVGVALCHMLLCVLIAAFVDLPHPAFLLIYHFGIIPAALPFGLGLLLFLRKREGRLAVPHAVGISCIFLFFAVLGIVMAFRQGNSFVGSYLALGLCAAVVAYLSQFDTKALPGWASKGDKFLGNLTYPIFLISLPVATALHVILPSMSMHTWAFFGLTLLVIHVTAYMLHQLVELPMNKLRRTLKC